MVFSIWWSGIRKIEPISEFGFALFGGDNVDDDATCSLKSYGASVLFMVEAAGVEPSAMNRYPYFCSISLFIDIPLFLTAPCKILHSGGFRTLHYFAQNCGIMHSSAAYCTPMQHEMQHG